MLPPATLATAPAAGLPLLEALRRILSSNPVNLPALDVLIDCAEDGARRAEAEADTATFHTAAQRAERGSRAFHSHRAEGYWQTARLARSARMIFADQPAPLAQFTLKPGPARQLLSLFPDVTTEELRNMRAPYLRESAPARMLDALICAAELEERGA